MRFLGPLAGSKLRAHIHSEGNGEQLTVGNIVEDIEKCGS
jgi:hypothetical protein